VIKILALWLKTKVLLLLNLIEMLNVLIGLLLKVLVIHQGGVLLLMELGRVLLKLNRLLGIHPLINYG
jgi:hypothetical protein